VLYKGIDNARQVYMAFANNLQVCTRVFTDYGKSYLRKNKLHPDTHVQLALQYAYYRTYKKPAPTYETATTRKFYNARTETMRSCTNEALDWCKAMCDPNASMQQKYHLYMRAMDRHNKLMAEAQNNEGCDRHLFGLQILAIESGIPMPQLYTDPTYTKSGGGGNYVLSTSFVGYTTVYGGVVPMVEHGYGSFYKIEPEKITIFVSSWASCKETDATLFRNTLQDCLGDMATVIDAGVGKSARL